MCFTECHFFNYCLCKHSCLQDICGFRCTFRSVVRLQMRLYFLIKKDIILDLIPKPPADHYG